MRRPEGQGLLPSGHGCVHQGMMMRTVLWRMCVALHPEQAGYAGLPMQKPS